MSNFDRDTLLVLKAEEKRPRLCEQQTNRKNNWHHDSILMDLSGDVAVIALHGYRTLNFKNRPI